MESLEERIEQLEKRLEQLESCAPRTIEEYIKTDARKHTSLKVLAISKGKIVHWIDNENKPSSLHNEEFSAKRIGSLLYVDRDTVINMLYPVTLHTHKYEGEIELINGERIYISNMAVQEIQHNHYI